MTVISVTKFTFQGQGVQTVQWWQENDTDGMAQYERPSWIFHTCN